MTLQEMKVLVQKGHKMTHKYFTSNEWLIMKGNIIIFEDDVKRCFDEWTTGKDYLKEGWKLYDTI